MRDRPAVDAVPAPAPPLQVVYEKAAPVEPPPATREVEPAASAPARRAPAASFSLDPVKPDLKRGWVRKGLRALRRNKEDHFVPARPLRQASPVMSNALASRLTGDVPVRLKLRVDKNGRVSRVMVVDDGSGHTGLIQLATSTAERWSFKPARLNNRPVESDVVARFRFFRPGQ